MTNSPSNDPTPYETAGFGGSGALETSEIVQRENPARSSEIVGQVAFTSLTGVDVAVSDAAIAQKEWTARPLADRLAMLGDAADAVERSADVLGPMLTAELGKPLADSIGEMGFAAAFTRYVCSRARDVLAPKVIDDEAGRVRVERQPFGVCAAVVPWNAPLILSSLKVAPALAAGNAIVVKPSPLAPGAVTEALSAMASALPPGLISVVHGGGDVGEALIDHPSVAKIAFTGGTEIGRSVLASAAKRIVPSVMELGGNDAAIMLDDAPFTIETAQRVVFGAFLTTGQVCMALKRLYVPRSELESFLELIIAAAEQALICGDPATSDVTIGPMISDGHRARVAKLVDAAQRGGAVVTEVGSLSEGWDPKAGYFLRPTVVTNVDPDAAVVQEEQFGPTLPIVAYDTEEQAIDWANGTAYGLGSSVWSSDEDRAFAVASKLEAGLTFINCHNRSGMGLRVPFGGIKESGFGREFGDEGIAEYTYTHATHLPATFRASTIVKRDGELEQTGFSRPQGSGRDYPTG